MENRLNELAKVNLGFAMKFKLQFNYKAPRIKERHKPRQIKHNYFLAFVLLNKEKTRKHPHKQEKNRISVILRSYWARGA